jgi:hypothetical protein
MVYVRLAQDWTDDGGTAHIAGDMVDVDAVTLAELEADGVVEAAEKADDGAGTEAWPGPTSPSPDVEPAAWPGPTSPSPDVEPAAWPGPTAPEPDVRDV